jgi:diacylglycerol kinase (ATP)
MVEGIASPDIRITSDSIRWSGPVTLANISNGAWIGGMFHIAPMADNRDGLLDLLIAAPVTRWRIMSLLPRLMRGNHITEPEITHATVRQLTIEAATPLPSHLDGEVQPLCANFDIEILPASLDLL